MACKGYKHPEEWKRKISRARTGVPLAPETVAKMRAEKSKVLKCPHCGITGKAGGMKRHHFGYCKKKGNANAIGRRHQLENYQPQH
jgi:hypothetical protein